MGKRTENKTIGDMADEAFVLDSEPVIVISGLQSSPQESNSIEKAACKNREIERGNKEEGRKLGNFCWVSKRVKTRNEFTG